MSLGQGGSEKGKYDVYIGRVSHHTIQIVFFYVRLNNPTSTRSRIHMKKLDMILMKFLLFAFPICEYN